MSRTLAVAHLQHRARIIHKTYNRSFSPLTQRHVNLTYTKLMNENHMNIDFNMVTGKMF